MRFEICQNIHFPDRAAGVGSICPNHLGKRRFRAISHKLRRVGGAKNADFCIGRKYISIFF